MDTAPAIETTVTITYAEPHPLAGMSGVVVHRYHDRRGNWFAVVRIDATSKVNKAYKKGDEYRINATDLVA